MVLAFWGIKQGQTEIARQLQTIPGAGTPGSRLRLLASSTLNVTYQEAELVDLQAALAAGVPPIVLVHTAELPYWQMSFAHAVVLVGLDAETAVLHDPAWDTAAVRVPLSDFLLAWDEMVNLCALIQKK